jgi:hypothetical protein
LESAYRQKSSTFQRISAARLRVDGVPVFDYWFTTEIEGRPRALGARLFPAGDRMLQLLVTAPGPEVDARSRALLDSFRPLRTR